MWHNLSSVKKTNAIILCGWTAEYSVFQDDMQNGHFRGRGKCLLWHCTVASSRGAISTPQSCRNQQWRKERVRRQTKIGLTLPVCFCPHLLFLFISERYSRMKEVVKAAVERMREGKERGERWRKRGTTRAWKLLQPEEEQTGFKISVEATVMLEAVGGQCWNKQTNNSAFPN